MAVLSQKRVKARKQHYCEMCHQAILPGRYYWRLFGMAETGDPPYAVCLCGGCMGKPDNHTKPQPEDS